MEKIASFPHMGNYYIPISFFINKILKIEVKKAPPITKKTLEIGSQYSPDFVCVPFKYNLGNFIEALEDGANVLIQAAGGCRFNYYAEVQEQILKDLNYDFEFFSIFETGKVGPIVFYKRFKKVNPKLNIFIFLYYFVITYKMLRVLEKIEDYIRKNKGFEIEKGSFNNLYQEFLEELKIVKNIRQVNKLYRKYYKLFKQLKINKPKDCLKVGIIGELFTAMEPFSSCNIENELANKGVEVTRITTLTYLVFKKPFLHKRILKNAHKYLKYHIGADGTDSISKSMNFVKQGYDGIIHTKPFACTPEVNAMPMLQKLSKDYNIPILYLSFDSQTSESGMLTRLEAFYDMLKMRKEKNDD
jgi:predicted nucleotide-binding protein (sugar kinase/HSP70/actin superfamily)